MSLLLIFALVCGLTAMIAMIILAVITPDKWHLFTAVGFLGVVLLAFDRLF